jgi:hypothetical protein
MLGTTLLFHLAALSVSGAMVWLRFVDDPDGGGLGVCVRFGAFQSHGGWSRRIRL